MGIPMFISAELSDETINEQYERRVARILPPGYAAIPKYNTSQMTGWTIVKDSGFDDTVNLFGISAASQQLAQAYVAAARIHGTHFDKAGMPEMVHCTDVANRLMEYGPEVQVIGLLHDSLEYMSVESVSELMAWHRLTETQISIISMLNRKPGVKYDDYILELSKSALGQIVKIADIKSNTDPVRMAMIPGFVSGSLAKRYFKSLMVLES